MQSSKESEKALSPESEIKSADQVRSGLLADLIHDLRTPLVAARGYAKLMLGERAGALDRVQQEYLEIIVQNMNRMIPLLNDLAELATAEPLAFEPLDLPDLWQGSLEVWKSHALVKSIRIQEKISSESLTIRGDRQKLIEVFEELLSRVVHSAEPGSEIRVELSPDSEAEVQLRISEGPDGDSREASGNDAAISESKSSQPELDIRLTMIQRIIRLHGGKFCVEKDARGRAAFVFTLPAPSVAKLSKEDQYL